MEKKKILAMNIIMSIAMIFITGIDSIFDNPFGLLALSVLLGTGIGIFSFTILIIAARLSDKDPKKIIEDWLKDEEFA